MRTDRRSTSNLSVNGPLGGRTRAIARCVSLQRFCWAAGVVGLVATLAACGSEVSSPAAIEGIYALRRLNGEPLPYDHAGLGCCTYLSGALNLEGASYAVALTARNRNTGQVFTAMEWGKYTRQSSSLTFAPDSVEVAPLILDVGTVSADTLRVAFGGEGPGSADQFQALYVRAP